MNSSLSALTLCWYLGFRYHPYELHPYTDDSQVNISGVKLLPKLQLLDISTGKSDGQSTLIFPDRFCDIDLLPKAAHPPVISVLVNDTFNLLVV